MKWIYLGLLSTYLTSLWVSADSEYQQDYQFSPLTKVQLNAFGKVDIRQGEHNQLRVIAKEDLSSYLQMTIAQGSLVISDTRADSIWYQTQKFWQGLMDSEAIEDDVRYEFMLSAPASIQLNGNFDARIHALDTESFTFTFNGLGNLQASNLRHNSFELTLNGKINSQLNSLNAHQLSLRINGAGLLETQHLFTDKLTASVNGSIICRLTGHARQLHWKMTGASVCQAQEFSSDTATIEIMDHGEMTLKVNKSLHAKVDAGSLLYYYGSPRISTRANNITQLAGGYQARTYY